MNLTYLRGLETAKLKQEYTPIPAILIYY
jgi:hypothetical protein